MPPIASLNVPLFKQEQVSSCTAACVRIVLAYHGRAHSEDEIRRLLQTRPRGTPARNVASVGSREFDVELKSSTVAELGAALLAGTPPLVYVDTAPLQYWSADCAHAAVLVGMDLGTIWLNDPFFDAAPQQGSLPAFLQAWAANAFLAAFIRPRP
jgi:ABC-type bacteriocin/lantibiotic exporter with double-glycine peptidase domain